MFLGQVLFGQGDNGSKKNVKSLKQRQKAATNPVKQHLNKLMQLDAKNKTWAKEQKRKAAPTTTVDTIAYKAMYEDGICEVEQGLYSKTIKFSDINYQLVNREQKEAIFARYCVFLNYFDPSISVQITIHNRHIRPEEFQAQMLIESRGDELDSHRGEYNSMLREKSAQGQNSIIREKYLTFTVRANSLEDAVPVLARVETDILANFKALSGNEGTGCDARTLTGLERLELLYRQFAPQEKFSFSYDSLVRSNLTTKHFVAPDSFDFSAKNYYEFGDQYAQTLFVRDLPPDLSDKLIADLSDIPCSLTITLHIRGIEQEEAFRTVKRKIGFMNQQKIDEQKKALKAGYDLDLLSTELKYSLDEAQELLDDMQHKNQRLFKATILINTSASDLETLMGNTYKIQAAARKHNCKVGILDYLQEAGMNANLPLGINPVEIERTLTTASTAIFVPFTTQELYQTSGLYYGLNALSRNLIFFDRKTLKNSNGFILGTPGSGKSFAAKREIVNVLLNTGDDVLIIDPEREYTQLAEGFSGEVIHISAGSQAHINPLDITMHYADTDNPLLLKSEFVLSLCELLIDGRFGLTAPQKTVIDRACKLTYQPYFANPKKHSVPTLQDFFEVLKAQPEPEAQSIALSLELYIKGSLSVFASHTNIDTDNRLIVFDILDLGKQLKTLGMLVVLDQIWNRITQNRALGKRTWIYIDEIYLLFQNEYSANYLFELYKRARKWGAIPTGITQNVEDLLLSDTARRMLSNTDFIMMLNQASSDRTELANLLNISDQQLGYVTNSNAGQGLLFAGSSIVPFVDSFPTDTRLYQMMTTKVDEMEVTLKGI